MIQSFDTDLRTVSIYAQGDELVHIFGEDRFEGKRVYSLPDSVTRKIHTFTNPVLGTDLAKIGELTPPLRDTLAQLYKSNAIETEYDKTSLRFVQSDHPSLWGPNIDTLLFCQGLRSQVLQGVGAEIGAGSGFISKYALEHNPGITELELIDINPAAISCWTRNISDSRMHPFIGDATRILNGGTKYDFLLCNPPYVPRPQEINDNAYEGLGLFTFLLENMDELLNPDGFFIANYSSLCEADVRTIAQKSGVGIESLVSKHVPLKVYPIYNDPEWLTFLETQKGLVVDKSRRDHWYWQDITIAKFSKE